VSLVSDLCCRYHVDARHCAHLLQHLDYTNILTIIMHKVRYFLVIYDVCVVFNFVKISLHEQLLQ
jgi:hypothetical protein